MRFHLLLADRVGLGQCLFAQPGRFSSLPHGDIGEVSDRRLQAVDRARLQSLARNWETFAETLGDDAPTRDDEDDDD